MRRQLLAVTKDWFVPRALTAAACALALACAGEPAPPSGAISTEAAQQLVLARDEARDALAARERELQRELAKLTTENADLRSQLGMAAATAEAAASQAEQYKAGLGRAVEELNNVSRAAAARAHQAPTSRYENRPRADVSYYSDPRVSIVDRSVAAAGRLFNSGDAEAVGTLYVELVRNGAVIATKQQPLRVNANSWASWQEEFNVTPCQAAISVRARLDF